MTPRTTFHRQRRFVAVQLLAIAGGWVIGIAMLASWLIPVAGQMVYGAFAESSLQSNTPSCGCSALTMLSSRPWLFVAIVATALTLLLYIGLVLFRSWRIYRQTHMFILHISQFTSPDYPVRLRRIARELGMSQHITLIDITQPLVLCAGLWQPRIIISRGAAQRLSGAELRAVLQHERYHAVRREPLMLLISAIVRSALTWVPGMNMLLMRFNRFSELSADEAATNNFRDTGTLQRALHKIIQTDERWTVQQALATLPGATSLVNERLGYLQAQPVMKERGLFGFAPFVSVMMLLAVALFGTIQPTAAADQPTGWCEHIPLYDQLVCSEPVSQSHEALVPVTESQSADDAVPSCDKKAIDSN